MSGTENDRGHSQLSTPSSHTRCMDWREAQWLPTHQSQPSSVSGTASPSRILPDAALSRSPLPSPFLRACPSPVHQSIARGYQIPARRSRTFFVFFTSRSGFGNGILSNREFFDPPPPARVVLTVSPIFWLMRSESDGHAVSFLLMAYLQVPTQPGRRRIRPYPCRLPCNLIWSRFQASVLLWTEGGKVGVGAADTDPPSFLMSRTCLTESFWTTEIEYEPLLVCDSRTRKVPSAAPPPHTQESTRMEGNKGAHARRSELESSLPF